LSRKEPRFDIRNQWSLPRRGSWYKEIDDHCLAEGFDVTKEINDHCLAKGLDVKRRTWILLLNCWQTPSEYLTFFRLKQKKMLLTFVWNDFQWFCGVWWMIWWCMKCYDFLFETIWYACMDAWMHEWNLLYFFIFSFLHKYKKCWRSYAYAHVINHWWCMTCYDFLFKLRRWCMHGCVDAWVKFALFKKMNYSCMHDLVWCMNFSFAFLFKTIFELIPISLLFLIHGVILLWFFLLKHYFNDMHEIAKGLKRFGWGDED